MRQNRKRSHIWTHFNYIDGTKAECIVCKAKISHRAGSTNNLHRHMRTLHPTVSLEKRPVEPGINEVVVLLEDGDLVANGTEAETNSALNDHLQSAHTVPVEQTESEEESSKPTGHKHSKRSLIWKHYEHLESLSAARCRICMKKLQCFEGSSTSNLRRHMSKRHPQVFSQLLDDGQKAPLPHTHDHSGAKDVTSPSPTETDGKAEKSYFSGVLKSSQASEGQRRLFQKEEELITALRRAQREEAQALEHQRELLEKLRAANDRKAAAQRKQIELLRKAQLEEAKDLSRQREELQRERAELQKKWEELQQESG